jgi:hypothetical protein
MRAGSDAPLSVGRSVGALFMVNLLLSFLLAILLLALWMLVALALNSVGFHPTLGVHPLAVGLGGLALLCTATGASMARHRSRLEHRRVTVASMVCWSAASIAVSVIAPAALAFVCLFLLLGFAGQI